MVASRGKTERFRFTMKPIRCEGCGRAIELETAADREGYLWTGRCRACRAGQRADFIGMIENLLGVAHERMQRACPWTNPDECATARERAVAGISDEIPTCAVHGARLREEATDADKS